MTWCSNADILDAAVTDWKGTSEGPDAVNVEGTLEADTGCTLFAYQTTVGSPVDYQVQVVHADSASAAYPTQARVGSAAVAAEA